MVMFLFVRYVEKVIGFYKDIIYIKRWNMVLNWIYYFVKFVGNVF